MELGDDTGTVEVVKLAGLVLLEADSLAATTITTRIAAIVASGRVLEKAELQGLLQAAEATATPPANRAP